MWWPGVYQRQARQHSTARHSYHVISHRVCTLHSLSILSSVSDSDGMTINNCAHLSVCWTMSPSDCSGSQAPDCTSHHHLQPPVTWVKDGGPMRGRVWPRLHQSQAELTKPSQFRLLLYDDAALGRGWRGWSEAVWAGGRHSHQTWRRCLTMFEMESTIIGECPYFGSFILLLAGCVK